MIVSKEENCLKCGQKLKGRTDKKFCDSYCRNSYNNSVKRDEELFIQNINSILRRNRKILKTYNREGKTTIRTEFLVKLDFNFNHFTHTYTTKNNLTYKFCYEFGYMKIDNEKTLIVTYQDYMKKA